MSVSVMRFLYYSLSGFARSLQERLMSLPVYDGCRPSSRYFSYNENQPDVSIEEVHRNSNNNSNSNNSRGVTAPSGLSITSAAAQSNSGINTSVNSSTGTSCGSSSNGSGSGSGSGNGSINESADTPDDCSVGVFLSKNYRYCFCALCEI